MQIQKLQNNQIKVTVYVAKIDSLPGKVNNTYHGKGKMNKYFRFAVRDDQNEVLEFLAPEDFNLSGLLLSLPGEKLVLNLEVHMDDVENPTYELVQFENLTQTLENINDEIMELMDAGDLWFYKKKKKAWVSTLKLFLIKNSSSFDKKFLK